MPLSVGNKLGSYEILASIGAGGMGEVYRAKDTKLEREVAIKVRIGRVARYRIVASATKNAKPKQYPTAI